MESAPGTPRGERLLLGLRVFGGAYTEITRRFAVWLGLHATDAQALIEILQAEDQGTPLTPARLAERIGLSSGATTNLLNRLERAGHVLRSREHADRRMVTLRSSPDIGEPAGRFFAPLTEHVEALVARHPAQALDAVESFLADLEETMRTVLDAAPPGEAHPARPTAPRSRPRSGSTAD